MPTRELVRNADEKRSRDNGGTTWRDIANNLDAELAAVKEERHASDVAMRTMAQDLVKASEENLRLGSKVQLLEAKVAQARALPAPDDSVDVQAEVEPDDEPEEGFDRLKPKKH